MPWALADDERAALQDLPMASWVDQQGADTAEEWRRLAALLAEEGQSDGFTLARWQWAVGTASQRSFARRRRGQADWVLVPGIDLCNHRRRASADHRRTREGWFLEATQALDPGDPVCIHYGPGKASWQYLLYYGFVPPRARDTIEIARAGPRALAGGPRSAHPRPGPGHTLLPQPPRRRPAQLPQRCGHRHPARRRAAGRRLTRGPAPDWNDPRHELRALAALEGALRGRLASFPTPLSADRAALAAGVPEHLERWVRYRTTCKALLARITRALADRQQQLRTGAQPPNAPSNARAPVWSLERITLRGEPSAG
ncbi:MAG: hypothetical protein R3F60_30100 [bacterium]